MDVFHTWEDVPEEGREGAPEVERDDNSEDDNEEDAEEDTEMEYNWMQHGILKRTQKMEQKRMQKRTQKWVLNTKKKTKERNKNGISNNEWYVCIYQDISHLFIHLLVTDGEAERRRGH